MDAAGDTGAAMTRISYTIHSSDLFSLDMTPAEVDAYEQALQGALAVAYPAADVEVAQVHNVSGGATVSVHVPADSDADDNAIEHNVRDIASATLDRVLA